MRLDIIRHRIKNRQIGLDNEVPEDVRNRFVPLEPFSVPKRVPDLDVVNRNSLDEPTE